jgi:lipid II:glycine glycyltransferase (peptidoglycan interpeptide bridge formation enzyme)
LKATSIRQRWPIYPEKYFAEILRVFGQHGYAKLFFAEYEGRALSSQLLIAFGDTVLTKNSGWSGQCRSLGPNNVLEWVSIQWAKAQGYRCYDLEGLTRRSAMREKENGDSGVNRKDSWCYYKLQYGGQVKLLPQAQIYIINPLARWINSKFLAGFQNRPISQNILNLIRLHRNGGGMENRQCHQVIGLSVNRPQS